MTVTSLCAQENMEDSRWETAVRCIKKYEGWHGPEHHPYVAYGHRIRKGEKFPARLTESEGDSILRKDLKEMCALFRHLGKDSLLHVWHTRWDHIGCSVMAGCPKAR